MNEYISKPFDPADLKRKIIELTETRSSEMKKETKPAIVTNKKPTTFVSSEETVNATSEMKIDLSYLRQIGGDNPAFIMQMIEMFLQKTPGALEEMNEKFRQQNWNDLKDIAHRIKPSYTYIGLKQIHSMLAEIENNSTSRTNLDSIPQLMNDVEVQSQAAFKALEQELQKLK